MGSCNYYHEFLPLYAKYSGPLTELLKVGKIEGKKGSEVKLKWAPYVKRPLLVLRKHWQMWFFFFFKAWRSPAEKTQSLLTLRGSSKDGRYVHFLFDIKP